MNFFKNFIGTFKAVRPSDEFYLDDSGKHIIFRNMNGKTVPIQVTAEEYAEWLEQQGVTIDPADQTQLRQIDDELEFLERAAEYGPGLQKQYEDYFKSRREQYAAVAQQYYQQALQAQGERRGVEPEKLHEDRKQVYANTKKDSVRRTDLPDRGWHSYAERYVDRIMEVDGVTRDNKRNAWDTMKVYQMVLMYAADLAKGGISPTEITLDQMLKSHSDEAVSTYFQDVMGKHANGPQDMSMLSGAFNGLKTLKNVIDSNSESAAPMREVFDHTYRRMYDDFHKEEISSFDKFEMPSFSDKVPRESIPSELPESFTPHEAQSLFGFFKSAKQKVTAANRVTLHALARLYEAIPEKDKAAVAAELSDGSKGLHANHQEEFMDVYKKKINLGRTVNVEDETEGILRLASRAAKSGTTEDISAAMKEIAGRLGRIDGIHAFTMMGEDAPSPRNFNRQWQNSSINAGRRKGEGPDLIANLVDDEARGNAVFNNRTLKLLHQSPEQNKENKNLEIPPKIKKEKKKKPEMETHGFTKNKVGDKQYEFTSSDGHRVIPGRDSWKVINPSGSEIGEVYIEGSNVEESISKALYEANQIISANTTDSVEKPAPKTDFPFKEPISKEDEAMLSSLSDRLKEEGLQIKTKIPGTVFEVSDNTGKSVGIARGKANGKLFMVVDGKPQEMNPDELLAAFKQPEPVIEPKPEPETTPTPEPSPKPAPIKITPKAQTKAEPTPETPPTPVDDGAPKKTIPFKFTDRKIKPEDESTLGDVQKYAQEAGLEYRKAGGHGFDVFRPEDNKTVTIAASKSGELFMLVPGGTHTRLSKKDFIEYFEPGRFDEPVKMDKNPAKRSSPKKDVQITRKRPKKSGDEVIPWDVEKYGDYGAMLDGTPTRGYAEWFLANQGYNNPTMDQIKKVIKEHKGIAPREVTAYLQEANKSINIFDYYIEDSDIESETQILRGFVPRRQ